MRRGGAWLTLLLTGCNGYQSALGGEGAEGANFVQLFTRRTHHPVRAAAEHRSHPPGPNRAAAEAAAWRCQT